MTHFSKSLVSAAIRCSYSRRSHLVWYIQATFDIETVRAIFGGIGQVCGSQAKDLVDAPGLSLKGMPMTQINAKSNKKERNGKYCDCWYLVN